MRTLTAPTIAAKNANPSRPYALLKWELPSPIGTQWFAIARHGSGDGSTWDNADPRVLTWGRVSAVLGADRRANVVGQCSITLRDDDHKIANWFKTAEPQRTVVTVYHQFAGLAEADMVAVHKGIVNAPVSWSEDKHQVALDVTDVSTLRDCTVGRMATADDFPDIRAEDEDKMLPLCFGKVRRSPCRAVKFGARTTLARRANGSATIPGLNDMLLIVNDASGFPQDEEITIYIENEKITGHFQGNAFHVTARGGTVLESTVTGEVDQVRFEDTALTGADEYWVGYAMEVTGPFGRLERKPIRHYDATNHVLTYGTNDADCVINATMNCWPIPALTAYKITSWPAPHEAGAPVYLGLDVYVYILNDAPSKAVHQLEGFGAASTISDYQTHIPLDPNWYVIDRNDWWSFPDLGHAVTTAQFSRLPSQLNVRLQDDSIWADLDGIEDAADGTGKLLENPADVISQIHMRFMGMTVGDIDWPSFDAARTSTDLLVMAFTLQEQKSGIDLCADLAFQSRCAEIWTAGVPRLAYLANKLDGPGVGAIGAARYIGTVALDRRDFADAVTEIAATYYERGVARKLVVKSSAAETLYGRRAQDMALWAYSSRERARAIATFWLNRWQYLPQLVALQDSPRRLNLELADVVSLDLPDWFGDRALGRVIELAQDLDSPGIVATIEAEYFPDGACDTIAEGMGGDVYECWRCETSCQIACEMFCTTIAELPQHPTCTTACESGCESGCEISCQTGGCETSCQEGCQTGCTTTCETTCQAACELAGCQSGCEGLCEAACEAACETHCEGACETACESGCQGTCQTGCEIACESGCLTSCEGACQTGCEAACEAIGCETSCQAACELACEELCETDCQAACEATACESGCEFACTIPCEMAVESECQTSCEVACEDFCETNCELACEATACETGCEMMCQTYNETGCTMTCETDCQSTCEIEGCQVQCEVDCMTGCEVTCESGCTTACETGCEDLCETICESACETAGCQVQCEVDCMTGCEVTCESGCTTACETGCEDLCETICESACETAGCQTGGCETTCEDACQLTGCEVTACETGCEVTCETGCETAGCQTGGCETECQTGGCETECQTGGCEATGCETGCETAGCQTGGCETECQTGGCETSCETGGCETSCETGGCETSCQTGCETSCETTCETGCETEGCQVQCEVDCMTGCETSCETGGCETSCETGCETSEEVDPDKYYCITYDAWPESNDDCSGDPDFTGLKSCAIGSELAPLLPLDTCVDVGVLFGASRYGKVRSYSGPYATHQECEDVC